MSEKTYTLRQLRQFDELKKRLRALESRSSANAARLSELQKEAVQIENERRDVRQQLEREFADLMNLDFLSDSGVPGKVELENTEYVRRDQKQQLLNTILSDYRREHPTAAKVSYQQIRQVLRDTYGIETKSIANFFVGMLDQYETVGGNRNKAILL